MTLDPQSSDAFFNDTEAAKAYRECIEEDVSPGPSLVVTAKRLIELGGLDGSFSPEDYAHDFLSRV